MGPRYLYESLASTQSHAIAKVRSGTPPMTRVVARTQWEGRGRLYRRWASPVGGLYLSVVVEEPARGLTLFPLAVGAELVGELREKFGVASVLKWPNDLLVLAPDRPPRKLAGILVDRIVGFGGAVRIVVGVGVNVQTDRSELPPDVRDRAVTLQELVSPTPSLEAVEAVVVEAVSTTGALLRTPIGTERALERCRAALYGVGRRVRVDGAPAGVLTGIDEDGALRIENGGRPVSVRSGDVLVEETA